MMLQKGQKVMAAIAISITLPVHSVGVSGMGAREKHIAPRTFAPGGKTLAPPLHTVY